MERYAAPNLAGLGRLQEWRERRSLSIRELASLSGVAASSISRLERGQNAPHPKTVRLLAKALGVEPPDLR
jgi:transcriptional regulator with XRE-family HTH domain